MNRAPAGGDGPAGDSSRRLIALIESGAVVSLLLLVVLTGLVTLVFERLIGLQAGWIDDLMSALLLWLVMVGSAVAAGRCGHMRVRALESLLPPRGTRIVGRLVFLVAAVVCLVLAWYGVQAVVLELEFNQLAFGPVPAWLVQVIVPAGFAVMSARFGAYALAGPIPTSDQRRWDPLK